MAGGVGCPSRSGQRGGRYQASPWMFRWTPPSGSQSCAHRVGSN